MRSVAVTTGTRRSRRCGSSGSPKRSTSNGTSVAPVPRLRGRYYGTETFTDLRVERVDSAINFVWGLGSPIPAVPVDSFSVRWEGNWDFGAGRTYRFTLTTDDGMRMWIDNASVLDSWSIQPPTTYVRAFDVAAGRHYLRVDYYEHAGEATAQVAWAYQGTALPINAFRGRYYGGETFTNLLLERQDGAVNFWWAWGSPSPLVPANSFTVRWEGYWDFPASGRYRFRMTADDGIRIWIDNALILDAWIVQPPTTYVRYVSLTMGRHYVRVDY